MSKSLSVVILAAGQGTRMKSALPKVLHKLAGKPLVKHVIDVANALGAGDIHVVYGHGGDIVPQTLADETVTWVEQAEQLGTGHAVEQAMPGVDDGNMVLILYGDVPLIRQETLTQLMQLASAETMGLLTVSLENPSGYGRIVRDKSGQVQRIVEQKDANTDELRINEVNTGMMALPAARLKDWLGRLENKNAQGEYYLTDVIAMAVENGIKVQTCEPEDMAETLGVNNRQQLAQLERLFQLHQAQRLMFEGVTLMDPQRFDLRGNLTAGQDVIIDVNVVFEGDVTLGDQVSVGPNCVLKNVNVASGTQINANSVLENADIGSDCRIGPFARIRPETTLADGVHVGNFVEIKKSRIGNGSKVNHLSYVGDTIMGAKVNVGAGTITCNYDGANKFQTTIGDNVFIGSDTQLVAPVTVNDGTTIGAGSTITRDTPANELTLSRSKQQTLKGWTRPVKKT